MALTYAELRVLSKRIGLKLKQAEHTLTTAESCTGGGIATAITDVAGSSQWFERGFITYSNQAKIDMLDVDVSLIEQHGAVSEPTVMAMAEGAKIQANAEYSVAVSGIAGPSGGSEEKPVGTVCFAWGTPEQTHVETTHFSGDREEVRMQACFHALAKLEKLIV